MKLYTRGQMVARNFICIAVGAAVAVCIAAVLILTKPGNKKSDNKSTEKSETPVTEVKSAEQKISDTAENSSAEQKSSELNTSAPFILSDADLNSLPFISIGDEHYTLDEYQNINVYDLCNEAVVNINTKVMAYDWFLQPYVQDGGSGSGSIINQEGYILTNVHVIQGASKIYISLYNGNQYEAEVIGQDLDSDLAVLKFTPPQDMELKTISFGNSKNLRVGQKVIAIGNPFGMERTMTTGIVSGLGRPIQNSNNRIIRDMIQTDSAINPGNSGGPLLDTNGQMIGINTMIMSSSGSSSGVGFAVPAETAIRVVSDLIQYGKVQRGTLAVKLVQNSARIAQYAGLDISTGMIVSSVEKDGNAEKAGIKGGTQGVYYGNNRNVIYLGGDIITKIDDIEVKTLADYYSALESKKPGDKINVTVRRNKSDEVLTVTLDE